MCHGLSSVVGDHIVTVIVFIVRGTYLTLEPHLYTCVATEQIHLNSNQWVRPDGRHQRPYTPGKTHSPLSIYVLVIHSWMHTTDIRLVSAPTWPPPSTPASAGHVALVSAGICVCILIMPCVVCCS